MPQNNGPTEGNRQSAPVRVSDVGEFGLIARVAARLGSPEPPAGPGDDAAVVPTPSGCVIVTTDLLVEGRHFRFDWSSPYDVGRKAAAQSLADVAAMGAVPTALLVGLACPPSTLIEVADGLADGLRDECAGVGAAVVGGDTVSASEVCLAVTALGDLRGAAPLTRSGARPGESVVLAGTVGRAAAGLQLLLAGVRDGPLVAAHRRPTPPYAAGPALARAGATSLLDVSDGLLADLGHVAAASGVVLEVDADALRAVVPGVDVRHLLTGGEDHGLAGTLPAGVDPPPGVAVIGRVLAVVQGADGPGVRVVGEGVPPDLRGGPTKGASPGGWDHFRASAG
ncbi:thiamine-monophosphate kinase [Candidatus Protofrankia californiensis]|uniref:Thiamine-monophosphate kinase n=1 Tax=Candidatus Protofrankia californiensis TaxID=1839754 RepID=A0A1C3PD48_9ACTN|nr:thiamine-monophosphate kinase [Candidatus Protofrankia californiensis]